LNEDIIARRAYNVNMNILFLLALLTSNVVVADPMLNAAYQPSASGPAAGLGWNGGIVAPVLSQVVVLGGTSVQTGGQIQCTAQGRDQNGNLLPLGPVSWATTDPAGSISQTGLYTAGTIAGVFLITAKDQQTGISGQITVTVNPPPVTLKSITVSGPASVAPGQSAQFNAAGVGSDGNPFPLGVITWSVQPPSMGQVTSAGLLSAGSAAGNLQVTASQGNIVSLPAFVTVTTPIPTGWTQLTNPFGAKPAPYNVLIGLTYDKTSGVLYASGIGVARSTTDGATWTDISAGLPPNAASETLFVTSTGALVVSVTGTSTTPASAWRWTGPTGWKKCGGVSSNATVNSFTQDGTSIVCCTGYQGDVWRSTDDGVSFVKIATNVPVTYGTGLGAGAMDIIAIAPNGDYYMGGEAHDGLFKSTDKGVHWAVTGDGYNQGFKRNMTGLVFGPGGTLYTNYQWNGSPMNRINADFSVTSCLGFVLYDMCGKIVKDSAGNLYVPAIRTALGVYKTSDGLHWAKIAGSDFGGNGVIARALTLDAQNNLYTATGGGTNVPGLWRLGQ
jgi:hypothetical protein